VEYGFGRVNPAFQLIESLDAMFRASPTTTTTTAKARTFRLIADDESQAIPLDLARLEPPVEPGSLADKHAM